MNRIFNTDNDYVPNIQNITFLGDKKFKSNESFFIAERDIVLNFKCNFIFNSILPVVLSLFIVCVCV